MYIQSLKLKESYRNLKEGLSIDLTPLTLLVGEQGCGKSSILQLLNNYAGGDTKTPIEVTLTELGKKGVTSYYFDSEKDNPRLKDPLLYTNLDGSSRGIGMASAIRSKFMSHGETLRSFTLEPLRKVANCVVMLDEPEAALSLKNQYQLCQVIKEAVKRNTQLVIATHCLPLIQEAEFVYSLEHETWMSSTKFIHFSQEV